MTAAAGTGGAAGAGVPPAGVPGEPKIPEPTGECPEFETGTIMFAGLSTQIEAGTKGEKKGALLFAWHATGGTARAAMSGVPMSVRSEITTGGGLVFAPQGNVGGGDRTDIAPPTGAWYEEDLLFADEVVACAVKNHNIDPKQIFATGCSAGGLMSGTFGLMRSSYVAAIAPNSGGINQPMSRPLQDMSRSPAAFLMHGGDGDNVIINFGESSQYYIDTAKAAMTPGINVMCNHSSGHCGASTALHEAAWTFMKAHPFGTNPSPYAGGLPAEFPTYCTVAP